jgi:hypothetical protein
MRYFVQSGNIALSAVILGQCAGLPFLSQNLLRTGKQGMVTALVDRSNAHQNRQEQLL